MIPRQKLLGQKLKKYSLEWKQTVKSDEIVYKYGLHNQRYSERKRVDIRSEVIIGARPQNEIPILFLGCHLVGRTVVMIEFLGTLESFFLKSGRLLTLSVHHNHLGLQLAHHTGI